MKGTRARSEKPLLFKKNIELLGGGFSRLGLRVLLEKEEEGISRRDTERNVRGAKPASEEPQPDREGENLRTKKRKRTDSGRDC